MPETLKLIDKRVLLPAEMLLALGTLGKMELLRLQTIARVYARGLPPDVAWDDLLQQALTRIILGARLQPEGLAMVSFVAVVMRSLRAEHWRRVLKGSPGHDAVRIDRMGDGSREVELRDPSPGPERSLSAQQELRTIEGATVVSPKVRRSDKLLIVEEQWLSARLQGLKKNSAQKSST